MYIKCLIDNINVTEFFNTDELEITLEAESEIFRYYLDSIDLELDVTVLEKLTTNPLFPLSIHNIEELLNKNVIIYYYGNKIFSGCIGDANYNSNTKEIQISVDSFGKIVAGLNSTDGSEYVNNELVPKVFKNIENESFEDTIKRICNLATKKLRSYSWILNPSIPNISNFAFYKNYIITEYTKSVKIKLSSTTHTFKSFGLFKLKQTQTSYIAQWYVGFYKVIKFGTDNKICYQMCRLYADGSLGAPNDKYYYIGYNKHLDDFKENINEWSKEITDYFNKRIGSVKTFAGNFKVSKEEDIYFGYSGDKLYRMSATPEIFFNYEFSESSKIGDIQREFAIVTNSLTYIDPNGILKYHKRVGDPFFGEMAEYDTLDHVLKSSYKIKSYKGKKPNLGDNILLVQSEKQDMLNYFEDFLSGTFKEYEIEYYKEHLESPVMLKALHARIDNKMINVGNIKSISYLKDTIKLTTEIKI